MSILERFQLIKDLGKGSYGKVKLGQDKESGKLFALKFIAKESLKRKSQLIRVNREIRLLKMLNHPYIIKIYEAEETETDIIMVMEYVPGGELFDYVEKKRKGLEEHEALSIFCQILSAVEYCHVNKVIHRDLKPENVLLDEQGNVKLIDFGFSNVFDPMTFSSTFCGSPYYAAPEVIEGKQYMGPEADVWSLGIILYILLSGRLPFVEDNIKKLCEKIKALDYTIPSNVPRGAKDLISRLLVIDRKNRITLHEIKNHYWISNAIRMHFINPLDIIPKRLPIIGVDEFIIRKLESYNFFPKESLLTRIFNDTDSPQFACYYLLKERFIREIQRQSSTSTRHNMGDASENYALGMPKSAKSTNGDLCKPLFESSRRVENSSAKSLSSVHPCFVPDRTKAIAHHSRSAHDYANKHNVVHPVIPSTPKPDLELLTKGSFFVQEMVNYLSIIPTITSCSLQSPNKYQCCTTSLIFTVEIALIPAHSVNCKQKPSAQQQYSSTAVSHSNWFTATRKGAVTPDAFLEECHASVFIQMLQGDAKEFFQLRQSIITRFI